MSGVLSLAIHAGGESGKIFECGGALVGDRAIGYLSVALALDLTCLKSLRGIVRLVKFGSDCVEMIGVYEKLSRATEIGYLSVALAFEGVGCMLC